MKKGVILLSGGIDSSTVLAMAKEMGYDLYCITILYGQRHEKEVESAKKVASSLGSKEHKIIRLPEGMFSGSSLTYDSEVPVDSDLENGSLIPSTYVPARNLVFLSIAVSYAESIGADAVFIGVTEIDYSGYPDCRPEFIEAFSKAEKLATKRGVEGDPIEIMTPIIDMPKGEIIKEGTRLGLDYGLTWLCYNGGTKACGACDTCRYRLKGFAEAGLKDAIEYEE